MANPATESAADRYARTWGDLKAAEAAETGEQFEPTRFERTRRHMDFERAEREHVDPETGETVIDAADYENEPEPEV